MNNKMKNKIKDAILKGLIWISAAITLLVLVWLIVYIVMKGVSGLNWEFVSTSPFMGEGGVLPMIVTTVYVVVITVAISTPVGVFSAVYLAEYAKPSNKFIKIIRFAIETLSGIPSIIYGLFGMIFFVIALHMRFSLISGALTLSIMVLPTIIRTTEESIKTVPPSYKEGSLALGATKLYTIFKIVVPSALPGIISAVILSIGRIVGETAAVIFTAGTATRLPSSLKDSGQTLAVHLYLNAKEGGPLTRSFATATILIILVAIINMIASRLGNRLGKLALQGSGSKK